MRSDVKTGREGRQKGGKERMGARKGEKLTFNHNPKYLHRKEKIFDIIIKDNLLNKLTILELINSQTVNW